MGELKVSDGLAEKLSSISSATIDRLLRPVKERWRYERKGNHSRSGNLLYKRIPLKLTDWDTKKVGYVEMDLVCHCGASTAGEFINTLSAMEISSGWWEGRYCESQGREFTHSRPSRKNDNACIEQKNYTHVRKPLGYLRYDTEEELLIINNLHRNELRLIKKERVDGRLKRIYDVAKTPYQRLIESGQLSKEKIKTLRRLYQRLNPVELKKAIDTKLERLYNVYYKKKKSTITVNPYKKQVPSMVTFFVIQQKKSRLPS